MVGRAYVRCYTPLALQPMVRLFDNVGELLKGASAAPVAVVGQLRRQFRLLGSQGLVGMVMAGIDMALWDARAQACGVPLVTLLESDRRVLDALRNWPFLLTTCLTVVLAVHLSLITIVVPLWIVERTTVPQAMIGVLLVLNTLVAVTFQVHASCLPRGRWGRQHAERTCRSNAGFPKRPSSLP